MNQRISALGVLAAMSLVTGLGSAAGESGDRDEIIFPDVKGSNLQGKDYELPGDFEGDLNLALVAFLREQQELVDTWLPFARSLEDRYEGFKYYELPTIYRANPAYRWFINTGMRRGIKDPRARAATITLFLDKKKFRRALDIPHEGTIYALLVEKGGRVIWRAEGTLSKAKRRALEDLLSKTLALKED